MAPRLDPIASPRRPATPLRAAVPQASALDRLREATLESSATGAPARPAIHGPTLPATDTLSDEALANARTPELARLLADRIASLARAQVGLVREEARGELQHGKTAGGLAGGAGALFVAALCCGLVAAILAIGLVWSAIWAALVGMFLFAACGVALGLLTASEVKRMRPERSLRQARSLLTLARHPFAG